MTEKELKTEVLVFAAPEMLHTILVNINTVGQYWKQCIGDIEPKVRRRALEVKGGSKLIQLMAMMME